MGQSWNHIGNPPPYLRHFMSRRRIQGVGAFCGARACTSYRRSDFPFRQRRPSTHSPTAAPGTHGHTPVCTNAHSPPRAWGGDAAASVRARVGTAWAVCSASPYRCSSVWHRIAGYSDARRRRQEAAVSKMAYFTALWHKAHASHASCAFFYVSVDRLQDVNYAHGLPALHAKWLTLSLLK